MSGVREARPWSIRLACLAFLANGLFALAAGLADLGSAQLAYEVATPQIAWTRDWTIVALSAEFTIALIPILWIWFLARPFARWMVTALGVWKLLMLGETAVEQMRHFQFVTMDIIAPLSLVAASLLLLFVPASNRYFARREARNVQN